MPEKGKYEDEKVNFGNEFVGLVWIKANGTRFGNYLICSYLCT